MAKKIIEARVIQKVGTEAEWLQNDLVLYKGEIALVSSGGNVINIKVGDGIHTFSELEYMYRGGFQGSINPTTTTSELPNGFYFAETSGTYTNANNVEVAEGYYTILEKNDSGWKIASSVKMPEMSPTGKVEEGNTEAVSGGEVYDSVNPLRNSYNLFDSGMIQNIGFSASNNISTASGSRSLVVRVEEGNEFEVHRESLTNSRFVVGYTEIEPIGGTPVLHIVNHDTELSFNTTSPIDGWMIIYLSSSSQDVEDISVFKKNSIPKIDDEIFNKKINKSLANIANKFDLNLIQNIGITTGNTISLSATSRSLVVRVKQGDLLEFNRFSKKTNRLTAGFTTVEPSFNVPVQDVVDYRNYLDFKIESPIDGWFVLYLSNSSESDYTNYYLFINSDKINDDNNDDNNEVDTFYENYINGYKDNIFNTNMLKNVFISTTGNIQYSSSASSRSILLNGVKGDRFYISLKDSNSNRFIIAESVDQREVDTLSTLRAPYSVLTVSDDHVIYEFNDIIKQLYIYITTDINTVDLDNIIIYKLTTYNENVEVIKKIVGDLKYYEADISESVAPGSSFFDLEASMINDIYTKFDELVLEYPDFLSKKLIGYGNSGLKDGDDFIPDLDLPIYEYSFKSVKEYDGNNSLNPLGYKVNPAPKIMIVAGLHGDEKSTVWATYRMLKLMLENNDRNNVLFTFKNQLNFNIVPICNPWGFNNNKRELADNIDANRVFPFVNKPSIYPEANALVSFVEENKDAYVFLDYHCLEGSRPLSIYMTSDNVRSWDLFGNFVREVSPRLKEIYGKPQNNVSEGFYTKTNGNLLERYVYYMYNIPFTAVIETYEDYGGVAYSQPVIQASEEILINYISSFFK